MPAKRKQVKQREEEKPTKRPQLNLTPPDKLIERLEALAEHYRGDAKRRNEVALGILDTYNRHWEKAEIARLAVVQAQYETEPDPNGGAGLTGPAKATNDDSSNLDSGEDAA